MEPILSYCGMRCDLCLAYEPNITAHPENRQALSDGWHAYFGFRIPAEQIFCSGCKQPQGETLDAACQVRPCASQRHLDHCAVCDGYICDKLRDRLVDFDRLQKEHGQSIPPADRERFIFPYENAERLAGLREPPRLENA